MASFEPSSYHHSNFAGAHQNPHAQQYQLATRLEQARRGHHVRGRARTRSPDRPAAGLESRGDTSRFGNMSQSRGSKTVNTDLTRYANSSSFRGTTPPQKLRYIFRPDKDVPEDYVSDGRFRTWEEVDENSHRRPSAYTDANGVEWLPVLGKDVSERDWAKWEARERRRVENWEARECAYMASHDNLHSEEWHRTHHTIHPCFLRTRNRDGSSHLLTPTGARPMTLLDHTKPWHEREYHHVGRDPLANYQTIFGGLEAEQARQRAQTVEDEAAEYAWQKDRRKERRDFEHARRKEEKMRLKCDLEVQKLEAEAQRQREKEQHTTKVVKKVIRRPDGTSEVVFVKRRVGPGGQLMHDRSLSPSKPLAHAPWGSSAAAHRNASRQNHADRVATTRAAGGWMDPATRHAAQHGGGRSRSRSRSHSRSRSRSTSSSRRRAAKRLRRAEKEEARRKKEHASRNSAAIQAGPGQMPNTAGHPRASDLEVYMLQQSRERRAMSLDRLGATLDSLDNLAIGGVGKPRGRDHARGSKRSPRSDSSSSRSGSSSSSAFSSSDSSRASSGGPRRHGRSRSSSSSTSRSPRRGHGKSKSKGKHGPSRSRSHSSSASSRSSSASSSRSHSARRSKHKKHSTSSSTGTGNGTHGPAGGRSWERRASFEEMDARIRSHAEAKWLKSWEKRYAKAKAAGSERQKRVLKEEKKEWQARRDTQHTLVQAATSTGPSDRYLQQSTTVAASSTPVLTDQYGTPISSYGTVYPQPQGTLLQQASTLEAYSASLAYSDSLLAQTRAAVEASVAGIENVVDGLRVGYATMGMDRAAADAQQAALHLSLRGAIRAREDRRKKTAALARANRDVLDELRRQESVIMDRGQQVEESIAQQAYDAQVRDQQQLLARQQAEAAAHAAFLHQQQILLQGGGRRPNIDGHRPRSTSNLALGGATSAQPFWYENKDVSFTPQHVEHNAGLRRHLASTGAY